MAGKDSIVDEMLTTGAFSRVAGKYSTNKKKRKIVQENVEDPDTLIPSTPIPEPEPTPVAIPEPEPEPELEPIFEEKKPVKKKKKKKKRGGTVAEVYNTGAFKNTASKFINGTVLKIIRDSVSTPAPKTEKVITTDLSNVSEPSVTEIANEDSQENKDTVESINQYIGEMLENSSRGFLSRLNPNAISSINLSNVDQYVDKSAHNAIVEAAQDIAANPNQSVDAKLKALEKRVITLAQSYAGGGGRGGSSKVSQQINQISEEGVGGIEFTGGFAGKTTTPGSLPWTEGSGITLTQDEVDNEIFKTFSFDRDVHLVTDSPYWSIPTPADHTDKGVFGGKYLPPGATSLFDFNHVDSDTYEDGTNVVTTGRIRLNDLSFGDTIRVRFDFNVIPQIANTTVEPALWYKNRDDDDNVTFSFNLPSQPIFYGMGTVGRTYLNRIEISAYLASNEDLNALAYPAIKADNPVMIQPISMLVTVIR